MNKINKYMLIVAIIVISAGIGIYVMLSLPNVEDKLASVDESEVIKLPEPRYDSETSIEKAIFDRRSIRDYKDDPMNLTEVSQLLWSGQGITDPRGYRTAPSAGALYPLELYIVAGNVIDLPDGIYKYNPHRHELTKVVEGDKRTELYNAALSQSHVRDAAVVIIFSAVYERTTVKYGERGIRYVHMEVGHAAQNIYLQAAALDLGTCAVGAFTDEEVREVINMLDEEHPLYIMPVGKK